MTPKNAQDNAIRQMIAAEVEMERIRRTQSKRFVQTTNVSTQDPTEGGPRVGRSAELIKAYADISSKTLTNARLKASSIAAEAVKKDFFGRPIQKTSASSTLSASQSPKSPEDSPSVKKGATGICYKYNEGFTNAIKRPIRIKDLFQSL